MRAFSYQVVIVPLGHVFSSRRWCWQWEVHRRARRRVQCSAAAEGWWCSTTCTCHDDEVEVGVEEVDGDDGDDGDDDDGDDDEEDRY